MIRGSTDLKYFIAESDGILIASLVGSNERESLLGLEACLREVEASGSETIVFNFHDFNPIGAATARALGRSLGVLRKKGCQVRLCFIHPDLKNFLIESGAAFPNEMADNMLKALQALPNRKAA